MIVPADSAAPVVAAGTLFVDPDGRVLLVHPTYKAGWDMPGGHVEPGESPARLARRLRSALHTRAHGGDPYLEHGDAPTP